MNCDIEKFVDTFLKQGRSAKKTAAALNITVDEVCYLLRQPEVKQLREERYRKGMMH